MATTRKITAAKNGTRNHELKKVLEDRRRELMHDVHGRIRDARTEISTKHHVLDEGESSEVAIQEDIEFGLIEMKAETLNRIDAALRRLDENTYGFCSDCGGEIAERRLRALPFAARCRDCEEVRETAEQRGRIMARRGPLSLVGETIHGVLRRHDETLSFKAASLISL
jgi:DnaK suppressor protein